MADVDEPDEIWAEGLLEGIRGLHVGDLADADDPRDLIESLPGVSIQRWLARPGSTDCWYAIVKVPAGWIGIYIGVIVFDEDEIESWSTCWPVRLQLLLGALTTPLAGPSHDPTALAMCLAGLPLPDEIDLGWHEGMLLHLLLHDLDPSERASHEVLLNLGYEQTVSAVTELANRVANRDRLDEAQRTMSESVKRVEPDVPLYVSPYDAETLLGVAYDQWPSAVDGIVRALLEDTDSSLRRSREIYRTRGLSEG